MLQGFLKHFVLKLIMSEKITIKKVAPTELKKRTKFNFHKQLTPYGVVLVPSGLAVCRKIK